MLTAILSPAKQIKQEDYSPVPLTAPELLSYSEPLLAHLRTLSYPELKKLLACNDKLAGAAFENLHANRHGPGTAAILSYDGIQYKYMAPQVFSDRANTYVSGHLRIVSGLYGLLRPFDGIHPYRLEMCARLRFGEHRSLYSYWGSRIADAIEGDVIVNLASDEYSKAVLPYLKGRRAITCTFAEEENGRLVEKGVYVKMARGRMAAFMAEHEIRNPDDLRHFDEPGYRFREDLSSADRLVFLKTEPEQGKGFDF